MALFFLHGGVVVILSARISSPGENLTSAYRMGDDGVFNVVFSLETSSWSSVCVNSLPKQRFCMWFLRGMIWRAIKDSNIKFLRKRDVPNVVSADVREFQNSRSILRHAISSQAPPPHFLYFFLFPLSLSLSSPPSPLSSQI